MASSLVQWEADPFFPFAEEVQNSADRMESALRTWRHLKGLGVSSDVSIHTRRLELITTLDTVKWHLEQFERAVEASATMDPPHFRKEASSRHRYFIKAIRSQVACADKELDEARGQYESQAMRVHSKSEDKDSLVDFLSGRLLDTDAGSHADNSSECQLENDCTIRGSCIANDSAENDNSELVMSSDIKKTPNSLSTSKDNLFNRQEDKVDDREFCDCVGQKPFDHLGKISGVRYGCETSLSSCASQVWTSAGVSLEILNDRNEAKQIRHGIDTWERTYNTSLHILTSDSKEWRDGRANFMEHPDSSSPFSVFQILKGIAVNDLEQGPRIRPGNFQKVTTDVDASKLENYEKDRTITCKKAFQLRFWMLQQTTHGRILQLVSALLIVISVVGIHLFFVSRIFHRFRCYCWLALTCFAFFWLVYSLKWCHITLQSDPLGILYSLVLFTLNSLCYLRWFNLCFWLVRKVQACAKKNYKFSRY